MTWTLVGLLLAIALLLGVVVYALAQLPRTDREEDRLARYAPAALADAQPEEAEGLEPRRIRQRVRALKKAQRSKGGGLRVRTALSEAGVEIDMRGYLLRAALVGGSAGALGAAAGLPGPAAAAIAPLAGYALPLSVLKRRAAQRQRVFTERFPDALDVIGRGLRSGLPMSECLGQLANESDPPVSDVFRRVVDETRAGMTLQDALGRALQRMPTSEMKFFVTVVNVQTQTGGNLAQIIENISAVIRSRAALKQEVKALTAQARTQALVIGVLPFVVAGVQAVISPDQIAILLEETIGQAVALAGLVWMALGILVMWRTIAALKI